MNKTTKTALITGATSGIGLAFAKLFAHEGYQVVLVGRKPEEMKKIAQDLKSKHNTEVHNIVVDLSEDGAVQKITKDLKENQIDVDVLINNAGFGFAGKYWEIPWKTQRDMMQVNNAVMTELTYALLPDMVKRGSGKILNVGSTGSFQPGPFMAIYYATKAFVLSFSEALDEELKGTGVSVTTLCPGATDTHFQKTAGVQADRFFVSPMMTPDQVAEIGYKALINNKPVVVAGWRNAIGAWGGQHLPHGFSMKMIRRMQE